LYAAAEWSVFVEVYIKPKKKTALVNKHQITVKDVADIIAKGDEAAKIEKMKLADVHENGKNMKNVLISVTDIIKKIKKTYPNAVINNVGETDTWVHCSFKKGKDNPWLVWLRVGFVSLILLVGAATAIMSFHTDGQIPKVFERYYSMFYGTERSNPPIIAIPYSIGLAVGIVVFYNHFFGKKITDDPTPIEVEIIQYETEVTEAMLETMEKRNEDA
jgi:stage V sporulation protein AA